MIEMQATDPVPCLIPVISLRPLCNTYRRSAEDGGHTA